MTYVGRVDDETPPIKPKPLPSDFYIEQAVAVQESVGGGVEIDFDDITKVVVDDECDMNASRIDNAQITLDQDNPMLHTAEEEKEVEGQVVSRIDEAKVKLDEKTPKDTPESPTKSKFDASRIDQAQVNLDELELQIEPASSSDEVLTHVESNVDVNEHVTVCVDL